MQFTYSVRILCCLLTFFFNFLESHEIYGTNVLEVKYFIFVYMCCSKYLLSDKYLLIYHELIDVQSDSCRCACTWGDQKVPRTQAQVVAKRICTLKILPFYIYACVPVLCHCLKHPLQFSFNMAVRPAVIFC